MKQSCLILSSLLLLGLTSCMKEIEVHEKPVKEVTDLKVPSEFSWSMSRDVLLTIDSPVETAVEIFSSKNCDKSSLLATLNVPIEDASLSMANSAKTLYVRYTKKGGTQAIMNVNVVDTRSSENINLKLPESTGVASNLGNTKFIYYPSFNEGTLLFEDSWPVKGDYDLNDLAALYNIQLIVLKKKVVAFAVAVKLSALGGYTPYSLYLQVDNLKKKDVKDVSVMMGKNKSTGNVSLVSKENEPLLFAFDWEAIKGSNGGNYYNTEDSHLEQGTVEDNLVYFWVDLLKGDPVSTWSHESFDFFIKRQDGNHTEIHLKGYKPTTDFKSGYAKEVENMGSAFYSTKDNFVWGIKVPIVISHPKERVSILEAYPDFAGWVTSGGRENADWYLKSNADKCVSLK